MNCITKILSISLIVLCSCAGPCGNKPSREPYEGFEWKELYGAGLRLWAQSGDDVRLLADPSIPGIVMVRNGAAAPKTLIRVYDLPENGIDGLIPVLESSDGLTGAQISCRFSELDSGRKGVRRFVLVPDSGSGPDMEDCLGGGCLELHESVPGKAVFMDTGQDAGLYDECSVVFSEKDGRREDELITMSGTLRIGHEVRSFVPDGSGEDFWIVDKTGTLSGKYDALTGGVKNGKAVSAKLRLEYNGKWDDGFAAEYDGVYFVREVVALSL